MKFLFKKISDDSLRSLNEEEIQKKLYGAFHKNTATQNTSVTLNVTKTVPFIRPQLATDKQLSHFHLAFKTLIRKFWNGLSLFPWKFSALVIGLIIISIYLLQFVSGVIHHFSKAHHHVYKHAPVSVSGSAHGVELKTEASKTSHTKIKTAESTTAVSSLSRSEKQIETPKKVYYAVQICTYQKEADAKTLSDELKRFKFSAFYTQMQGSQTKSPYYVVFLGKNESFAGVQAKLREFRKSDEYQKFPDAFVRSI